MNVLVEEKSDENEPAPATQVDLQPALPESRSLDGSSRRVSGSPTSQTGGNLCVSEMEDNGDNDSVAAPVSEIPQDDGGNAESDAESDYEYEDDDDAAFGGFLATEPMSIAAAPVAGSSPSSPARIVEEDGTEDGSAAPKKPKWKEPSRQAVNMSLRAERETSGGKRRLAQDLYKIMMADTKEAGFSLAPSSEDSMDKWTIKLFGFDKDSNLYKDMLVLGLEHIELEMSFPEQYPFEPPFVRVVRPRFKRQTGFVMNGALCMELLTTEGWNPVNDIESVIVSVRSLLVVGDGRLSAAVEMPETKREAFLAAALETDDEQEGAKRERSASTEHVSGVAKPPTKKASMGEYSVSEARSAYSHLSSYHKEKGWDQSGYWARKG